MGSIKRGGLDLGLALLVWTSVQTTSAPAMKGTPEADLASAIAGCPVMAPVLADRPEPTRPAGRCSTRSA